MLTFMYFNRQFETIHFNGNMALSCILQVDYKAVWEKSSLLWELMGQGSETGGSLLFQEVGQDSGSCRR